MELGHHLTMFIQAYTNVSQDPGQAGEIEASLPTLSQGQALCPRAASAVQTLSQAVQPGANAHPLSAWLPACTELTGCCGGSGSPDT